MIIKINIEITPIYFSFNIWIIETNQTNQTLISIIIMIIIIMIMVEFILRVLWLWLLLLLLDNSALRTVYAYLLIGWISNLLLFFVALCIFYNVWAWAAVAAAATTAADGHCAVKMYMRAHNVVFCFIRIERKIYTAGNRNGLRYMKLQITYAVFSSQLLHIYMLHM